MSNILDPDQARSSVGPDLGPICLKDQQRQLNLPLAGSVNSYSAKKKNASENVVC